MDATIASEEAAEWKKALESYLLAANMAKKAKLERERREAEVGAEFVDRVMKALRAEKKGDIGTARGFWAQARKKRPDHEAVKRAVERLGMIN
jgi:hypothetical protein